MTFLDSAVRDTQWVGPSDLLVFTYTEQGHLWRSKDGGVTWSDETDAGKLEPPRAKVTAAGTHRPEPGVRGLLYTPLSDKKVFFRGDFEFHWLTEDGGDTYKQVRGPQGYLGIMPVRFHPSESDWFLAMARRWACYVEDPKMRRGCADDLFLTKDFGKTWTNLTLKAQDRILSFLDFDWVWSTGGGARAKDGVFASVFENRPEVRQHLDKHGMSVVAGWDQYVDFVRTDDLFRSKHAKAVACGNQFEILGGKVFLAVAEHCGGQKRANANTGVRLAVSADGGATFSSACFPVPLSERGYSVVDVSQRGAFVNVDYAEGGGGGGGARGAAPPFGTLFASDANFTLFTLSLRRNTRSLTGVVDFSAVQGLPGVYIANQADEDADDVSARAHKAATVEELDEKMMSMGKLTTLITVNGGGMWAPLTPPAVDADGAPYRCLAADGCSLHLHGSTSWAGASGYAFVYSHPSTPGTIMATGNVGRYLLEDGVVNTYLSRDGGATWREVARGAFIYEFGDAGGVVVMARHGPQGGTDHVEYSLDEGLTWQRVHFPPKVTLSVFNIRVEPDNTGRRFIIQARQEEGKGAGAGALMTIDFQRNFPQYKLCKDSDYEMWSPSLHHCLLGVNITLQRQVEMAQCWNTEKYRRPEPAVAHCNCTEADYECDFGTEHVHGRGCVPIPGFSSATCPALASGAYRRSPSNQRLVGGDACGNPSIKAGHYEAGAWWGVGGALLHFLLGVLLLGLVATAAVLLAANRGWLPDAITDRFPVLERFRYHALRGEFRSLADEFGLGGPDEEGAEEMYHQPPE